MEQEKKKGRIFDLPETKGSFEQKGLSTGLNKEDAYKDLKTKTNKDMRIQKFGVNYAENKTLYVNPQK